MIKNINTYFQENSAQKLVPNYEEFVQYHWSKFFCQLSRIRNVVLVGDVRDKDSLLLMILAKRIIIVDDGMVSLSLRKDSKDFLWVRYRLKRFVLKRIWKSTNKEISVRSILVKNDIESSSRLVSSERVLVVGSDLVECGIVSESNYTRALLKVLEKYPEAEYYPHRGETKEYWQGVYIQRTNDLLEYIGDSFDCGLVIGFNSTALFVLKQTYRDLRIEFVNFDSENLLNHQDIYRNAIEEFKSIGIEEFIYSNK